MKKQKARLGDKKKNRKRVVVPFGQIKLRPRQLDKDHEIVYKEVRTKLSTQPRYFNVRKQKICKERTHCHVLLDLTPSVIYEHTAFPLGEPEVPVTYKRAKPKSIPERRKKVKKVNLDDSDWDKDEDYVDSSSDSVEIKHKERRIWEVPVETTKEVMPVVEEEEEKQAEAYEDEDVYSVVDFPKVQKGEVDEIQVDSYTVDTDVQEHEQMTTQSSWITMAPTEPEKMKSLFNYCENITQTTNHNMETFCGIQTEVPGLTHVGGKFCTAAAYDAYLMFRLYARQDPRESIMKMIDGYEKSAKDRLGDKKKPEHFKINFATLKMGRHVERVHERKQLTKKKPCNTNDKSLCRKGKMKFKVKVKRRRNKNAYYEIDDIVSSSDEIELSNGSALHENAREPSSDDDEEEEEPNLEEDKDSEDEKKTGVHEERRAGDDIDGFDLVPKDFFDPSENDIEDEKKMEPAMKSPSMKSARVVNELKILLTTAQREQIINHLINPFDYEPVVVEKDEGRDVNFDDRDSDDDFADDGQYLLNKYGILARGAEKKAPSGRQREKDSMEEPEKKRVVHKDLKLIERLREIHKKHREIMFMKKRGGVVMKKNYDNGHTHIPKQRKVAKVCKTYIDDRSFYHLYSDEYERLTLATRLIHHKQFSDIGWDFLVYEDNDDPENRLFPLKKLRFFGSKPARMTHMCWLTILKHNLITSYESYQNRLNSVWREGHIVISHPLASTDYDHVYTFNSGVRHFDIARETSNKGFMLVALEDGNIELVKIPYPKVIQSTTPCTKYNCPVEQVMWMSDWLQKDKQGNICVRYQRFLSYGADGKMKLWWNRPHIGFRVNRNLLLDYLSVCEALTPKYRKITYVACHPYHRTVFYIGSELGKIYKYNILKNACDCVLDAHRGPVTVIAVNTYNSDVFLSGGACGMVKLWRGNGCTPIWGYYFVNPIADIKWSPFTSYVWTAVTRDNFVHIYNLQVHFQSPVTSQHVLAYSSCVKVDFDPVHPLLMIADNYSNVFALKVNRMAVEPDIVAKEERYDPRKPEPDDGSHTFDGQRKMLRTILDKNEKLVKICTRINKGMFEKLMSDAVEAQ